MNEADSKSAAASGTVLDGAEVTLRVIYHVMAREGAKIKDLGPPHRWARRRDVNGDTTVYRWRVLKQDRHAAAWHAWLTVAQFLELLRERTLSVGMETALEGAGWGSKLAAVALPAWPSPQAVRLLDGDGRWCGLWYPAAGVDAVRLLRLATTTTMQAGWTRTPPADTLVSAFVRGRDADALPNGRFPDAYLLAAAGRVLCRAPSADQIFRDGLVAALAAP